MTANQASVEHIRGVLSRLRDDAPTLRARDPEEILASLCGVLDSWRDPGSPWRARLEAELPGTSGFSAEVVREGLTRALEGWTGEALRTLVQHELGERERGQTFATGFDTTAVLLAGAIPMPSLLALLLPLVLRSPVLAKPSARDPLTAVLVAESLRHFDPALARHLEVVPFAGSDAECTAALLQAPCVLAYGSDATIASVSESMIDTGKLIAHGHRLSIVVVGADATRGRALVESCEGIALDAALWDQLGCLSPVAVYVEDADGDGSRRVAAALASAMEEAAGRWPRGELSTQAAVAVANERSEAGVRAATEGVGVVHEGDALAWSVVLEGDARWRPSPLHRFLRVHPVAARSQLRSALAPIAEHLATIALCGFGQQQAAFERDLRGLGVSRFCSPGEMQAPPIDWQNDGQPLLTPLICTPGGTGPTPPNS